MAAVHKLIVTATTQWDCAIVQQNCCFIKLIYSNRLIKCKCEDICVQIQIEESQSGIGCIWGIPVHLLAHCVGDGNQSIPFSVSNKKISGRQVSVAAIGGQLSQALDLV